MPRYTVLPVRAWALPALFPGVARDWAAPIEAAGSRGNCPVIRKKSSPVPSAVFRFRQRGFSPTNPNPSGGSMVPDKNEMPDFRKRVVVDTAALSWTKNPGLGVSSKVLEDFGGDGRPKTLLVRMEAGVRWSGISFSGGGECFVLEGVLREGDGCYPEGSYVRGPSGRPPTWSTDEGCVFFLKSGYLEEEEQAPAVVSTRETSWLPGLVEGLSVMPLSRSGTRNTALVRWDPGTRFVMHRHYGGEEILVVRGVFEDEHGRYGEGSWIQSPHLSQHTPFSEEGCIILVKTGHLPPGGHTS